MGGGAAELDVIYIPFTRICTEGGGVPARVKRGRAQRYSPTTVIYIFIYNLTEGCIGMLGEKTCTYR